MKEVGEAVDPKKYFDKIIKCLHALHAEDVIHGDPRVQNIIRNRNGVLKWIDVRNDFIIVTFNCSIIIITITIIIIIIIINVITVIVIIYYRFVTRVMNLELIEVMSLYYGGAFLTIRNSIQIAMIC